MLNKKAIAPGVLVGIIAMLIVFIVLFRLDILIANMIKGGAEDQLCFWSAGISSFSKVGPKTISDLYCPRRIVHVMIDSNDIPIRERSKDVEYVYINKQITKDLREKLDIWYEGTEDFQDKNTILRYRLNEVIAKELKKCWGNLGSGTYDLFDQDLKLFGYEEGTIKEDGSILNYLKLWNIERRKSPKICHICSTILFHEDVKSEFEGEEIDLEPFLKKNPVKLKIPEAISYYEFLEDDIITQGDLFRPGYIYTTDKTLSVVFLRMNMHSYIGEIFGDILSLRPSEIVSDRDYKEKDRILAIDAPLLMPFDEVNVNCDRYG